MRGYSAEPITIDGGKTTSTSGVAADGNWVAMESTEAGEVLRLRKHQAA